MFNTNQFSFVKSTGTLIAEASTLGFNPDQFICIASAHTGKELTFEFWGTKQSEEQETVAWVYVPQQATANIKRVVIIND